MNLNPTHQQQLAASAIAEHIITARGYCSITPGAIVEAQQLAGGGFSTTLLKRVLHQGALAFPVRRLGEPTPYTWVLRPDQPRTDNDGKPIKYEYPRGVSNIFDVLPAYHTALVDPSVPIWLTEGAKKADALASVYDTQIVPINLNGVWGWRGRSAAGGNAALPDLELIAWEGRQVVIAPDGDAKFNKHVLAAVQRLARLLLGRYRVGEVLICSLPQKPNDAKIGIDDYLASGHTTADLESMLTSLGSVTAAASVTFGQHPDTGAQLLLPPGYDVQQQTIVRLDERGTPKPIYRGAIYVAETGADIKTGEQTAQVRWNGAGKHGDLVIPRSALTDAKTFGNLCGGAGAALHPQNTRDVATFLVEFIQSNADNLPHRAHTDVLGLMGSGVVLPAGVVGFNNEVRYSGRPIGIGSDPDAYPNAIKAMVSWNAWAAWLVLGLALAGPVIARLHLRRNPVAYLAGLSGSGKTTLAQWAIGVFGDPTRHPFRIEAGRTTIAGIFQTFDELGGLPALLDEAHTVPDHKKLENNCYSFANGQRYTTGSQEGKAKGGGTQSGALILAGEALPEFKHAGSRLRVLWLDCSRWLPLGAEPRSQLGQERAALLEQAWETGAGLFGLKVLEQIWAKWDDFLAEVRELEGDEALASLQAWRKPLAIAAACVNAALQVAGVTELPPEFAHILDEWSTMLRSGHDDSDPAVDAWEQLITMLAQGRRRDDSSTGDQGYVPPQWEWVEADRGGGVIACRKTGDTFWRVLSTTPQFRERIGPTAVQLYGQTWVKRGWVLPGRDGKATDMARTHTGESLRVLRVPAQQISAWGAPDDEDE